MEQINAVTILVAVFAVLAVLFAVLVFQMLMASLPSRQMRNVRRTLQEPLGQQTVPGWADKITHSED
jgi:Na+-translocating ferredoxin:NAD+ oxidoreductase RnfG subunit